MESLIFNIQKYSIHDGPGIRTIVFLKGCSLSCLWCSNPESQSLKKQVLFKKQLCVGCNACLDCCPEKAISLQDVFGRTINYSKCKVCLKCVENCPAEALVVAGKEMTVKDVIQEVRKDSPFYRKTKGGVTVSGGEPFCNPDFLSQLLKELKNNRIHTAVETTGYASWDHIEKCLQEIDLFLFDLKHPSSEKHKLYTGVNNELILENLGKIDAKNAKIWIRIPVIPGFNDDMDTLLQLFDIVSKLKNVEKVDLLPYHRLGVGKYMQLGKQYRMQELEPPSQERLYELKESILSRFPGIDIHVGS